MLITLLMSLAGVAAVAGTFVAVIQTHWGWEWMIRLFRLQRFVNVAPPLPANLVFRPPVLRESTLAGVLVIVGLLSMGGALVAGDSGPAVVVSSLMQRFWSISGTTMALAVIGVALTVQVARQRYIDAIDRELLPAMDRLATAMDTGRSFSQALATVVASLPLGPLRTEWQWLLDRLGASRSDGTRMMVHEVCATLAAQTLSAKHATVLLRLSDALNRPHDAQVSAVQALVRAMQETARRMSTMTIELAQMRTSGIAIFLINVGITLYMGIVQWNYMVTAYRGVVGVLAAMVFGTMMLAPLVVGQWLSRVDDVQF